ncbi:ABC transporter permease [Streptomyces sp. NPDC055078]
MRTAERVVEGTPPPGSGKRSGPLVIRPTQAELEPRRSQARRRRMSVVLGFVTPVVLFGFWQIAATNNWIDVRFFPAPSKIGQDAWALLTDGTLMEHVTTTMRRVVFGYVPGVVLGIAFGLLLGTLPIVSALFRPTVNGAFTIPKLGIFPLLLLILGIGDSSKVALVVWGVFLMVTIATSDACVSVPSSMFDVGKAFKVGYVRRLFEIVLPASLPQIFTSLRLSMGVSILVVIATEFIAADAGVGYLIWHSWSIFQPAPMYVGIVVSALIGVVSVAVIGIAERLCTPWARSERTRRALM